jgi:hypothetical protein
MLEDAFGRLVSGALWGLGAGLAVSVVRGGPGGRSVAKGMINGYLAVADRFREMTAEARESLEDLTAEARAERDAAVGENAVTQPQRDGAVGENAVTRRPRKAR